jgi:N-acetylglucosaminyldiphosphoundecaprenol N-acetyl-beta-D-mannosaminyltransferase
VLFDGLKLWAGDSDSLVEDLIRRAKEGISTLAFYLNAHTYNLTCQDVSYRGFVEKADVLYADGMSIVWATRLGGKRISRMTAVDFFDDFLQQAAKEGLRLYFLGGRPGVVDRAAKVWKSRYPGLQIAGMHHGYFNPQDKIQLVPIIADINSGNADVLILGMGSPMQESFACRFREELQVPIIWAVGALFDYYAGEEKAAPRWLARMGFEWLYRLCRDPRNKWRRYLIGNITFAVRAGRVILKRKTRQPDSAAE